MKAKSVYVLYETDSFFSYPSRVLLGVYSSILSLKSRLKLEGLTKEEIEEFLKAKQINAGENQGNSVSLFAQEVRLNEDIELITGECS